MEPIQVGVHGILGSMGQEVLKALCREPGMAPVGGVDARASASSLALPDGSGTIPLSSSFEALPERTQAVVDFSNAEGAMSAMRAAAPLGFNLVIGSTGLGDDELKEAADLSQEHQVGIVVAPNFAMGAVLMTHLVRIAGRFFDYAELTEVHHEAKIDAPSGTALAMARAAVEGKGASFTAPKAEREVIPGTRGGAHDGVSIHSGRMPGRVAHHELVFGALGQTLTIRHDTINRESFMPGVIMAIRKAIKGPGLTVGLEKLMGL